MREEQRERRSRVYERLSPGIERFSQFNAICHITLSAQIIVSNPSAQETTPYYLGPSSLLPANPGPNFSSFLSRFHNNSSPSIAFPALCFSASISTKSESRSNQKITCRGFAFFAIPSRPPAPSRFESFGAKGRRTGYLYPMRGEFGGILCGITSPTTHSCFGGQSKKFSEALLRGVLIFQKKNQKEIRWVRRGFYLADVSIRFKSLTHCFNPVDRRLA